MQVSETQKLFLLFCSLGIFYLHPSLCWGQ